MAAPAFVSSTGHTGNPTTSATVTLPVTAADDILILIAVNGGAVTALTPSGTYNGGAWASIGAGAGTAQWGGVWWSRATGNHTGQTVVVGTATDSCSACVGRISGCLTGASPVDTNVSSANLAANGLTLAAFTTTVADVLVVLAVAADDNIAMSGQTKNGVAMAERGEHSSTGGADSIVGWSTLDQASAGTTGAFAGTHASSLSKRLVGFALMPPTASQVSREWAVAYEVQAQVSREWAVVYQVFNQVAREWAVSYQIGDVAQVSAEWAVAYDIGNQVSRDWAVAYQVANQIGREWAVVYDIRTQISREWAVVYEVLTEAVVPGETMTMMGVD